MRSTVTFYRHEGGAEFGEKCGRVCVSLGCVEVPWPWWADFAIAPLMRERLESDVYEAPDLGTLIFHPSALPYRRGPDAIRSAIMAGDRVSASTWFWCSSEWDAGDVCEQEVVVLAPTESPGRAYHARFVPAGLRALARAVRGIVDGRPRRVRQDPALATYNKPLSSA